MKTITKILIGILTVALMPMQTTAQVSEKLYQVTADGKFQFSYWQSSGVSKGVIHPITPRTFYLETRRQRLMPEDFSFSDFLKLPTHQMKSMMEFSQKDVIAAAVNYRKTTEDGERITVELESMDDHSDPNAALSQIRSEGDPEVEYPWLIRGVSQPADIYKTPDYDASDELLNSQPGMGAAKEIPWMVRLILLPETLSSLDGQKESNMQAVAPDKRRRGNVKYFVSDPATHLLFQDITRTPASQMQNEQSGFQSDYAEKRDRLLVLLNDLMAYQDDEVKRNYGWVFPAMEGKLYGTSEGELNEILSALLNMKDHFLTNSKPEVNEIFDELEALAFGR